MGGDVADGPVLFVVDDDAGTLATLAEALRWRFGADYRILADRSATGALAALERLRDGGEPVAMVLADLWMPEMTGLELLVRAHRLHPDARRAVIFEGFDRAATETLGRAMSLGHLDTWLFRPFEPAEQHLYSKVGELLGEWTLDTCQPGFRVLQVVAEIRSARTHELRDMLDRNEVLFDFFPPDSAEGRQLLEQAGVDGSRLPVVVYHDGRVHVEPSIYQILEDLNVPTHPAHDHYDLVVVGAGPAGLSAAMCGASEGLRTLMIEPRSFGGQASSTSMIRNYLGFPRGVSGRKLAGLAFDQCVLFGAQFVFDHATALRVRDGLPEVTLAAGGQVTGEVVVIGVGVDYRRLGAPGVDDLLGKGVFYGAAVSEAPVMRGESVFVVGAGNSAGQAAVHLARFAAHVTLLVRRDTLAATMSDYLVKQIAESPAITVRLNTQVAAAHGNGHLEQLTLCHTTTQAAETVPAGALFVMIGAQPHTEWLADTLLCDDLGYIRTGADLTPDGAAPPGWPLARDPYPMETSVPGVFAVGDVRRGSVKRVASAVGAGSIAIQFAHRHLTER